jgi:diaminohydroxyphosphoribosylaminopyrimidine deaminase / 5-amino-6-(5-phosphoribosylamino)uracil reductase
MTAGPPKEIDAAMMRRALRLAETGWGRVHPNPLVGAVVVRDGEIVGEGAHREFGGDHAEVEALRAAGDRARGATLYVTLEPCAHHGKTPPCVDAVIAAGVRRVVFAAADPSPEAGGGGERLVAAGIGVTVGVERDTARRQNAAFFGPLERGRPFLALKLAISLDGRIARREGERTRITGPEADAEVQRLRAGFGGIMVGGRTARVDDPVLTARGEVTPRVPPVRIVVSAGAELSAAGRLAETAGAVPVWVVAADDAPADRVAALEARGVRVLGAGGRDDAGHADPRAVLRRLAGEGVRSILCEGGGRLGAALLQADLVDRMYLFHAPVLLGPEGVPAFPGPRPSRPGRIVEARVLGRDALTIVEWSD